MSRQHVPLSRVAPSDLHAPIYDSLSAAVYLLDCIKLILEIVRRRCNLPTGYMLRGMDG
jgi:hypothetical protein